MRGSALPQELRDAVVGDVRRESKLMCFLCLKAWSKHDEHG